ncbi:CocE/NonD family hydrolase [Nocardia rhizosphaerihabitans]|uniref:CocE/NonD family hydrolase n=1 Tax=Nocardia rhizosphaerihabitans TaxID=1691570 RepID=UPI00366CE6C9
MDFQRIPHSAPSPLATEYMVPMRDGVQLATDVYLPDQNTAPGPVILVRLPYDKTGPYAGLPEVAEYFTGSGYTVVVQDVRGKFRSEGETLLFVNEADDGYDTIDWIIQQEWSNGTVGMWGDSYYGFTQWAAVSTRHPALRAVVPRVTGTRLGQLAEEIPGTHTREIEMGVHRTYPLTIYVDNDALLWEMDWTIQPLNDTVEKFLTAVGTRSASYDLWYPNPVPLRRFRQGSPFDAPAVPVLMTIGWWDNCAPWQWDDHRQLQQRPQWALNEYLLIEAIDHECNSHFEQPWLRDSPIPTPEERRATLPRYLDPAIEFFDIFLRGKGSPADLPRVRWQLANTEPDFRISDTWPPAGVTELALYPIDGTAARGQVPGGALATAAGAATERVSWKHDPSDPVKSPAPNPFTFLSANPDEQALGNRPDVLTFTAATATEPVDLVGPVSLRVQVRSEGPEMDVFARLLDVAPDGAAHLIARGQLTVLDSGYDSDIEIDLGHLGYRLETGHALRLTVAASDSPEHVVDWGLGGNRWAQPESAVNSQSVTLGGDGGAVLTLSVLPAG